MASQVTGYRYFSNFLLFIGNPIEKMLGINFDKRGWLSPFVDKDGKALGEAAISYPSLYGENEGGVAGIVHVQYGTDNQEVLQFYKGYMESQGLPASAYPYQSYLAFTGAGGFDDDGGWVGGVVGALMPHNNSAFYLGNSGYMKEMMLWPKRTRVRNDGREQWYKVRPDDVVVCEISNSVFHSDTQGGYIQSPIYVDVAKVSYGNILEFSLNETAFYNPHENDDYVLVSGVAPLISTNSANNDDALRVRINVDLEDVTGLHRFEGVVYARGGSIGVQQIGNWLEFQAIGSLDEETGIMAFKCSGLVLGKQKIGIDVQCIGRNYAEGVWGLYCSIDSFELYKSDGSFRKESEAPDINPIHKIREILTDDAAMNKPESEVNDANFMKAADWIWDEGLGISWAITEKSCMDAINELCAHIEAGVRINRQTGLYEAVLFRDDWFRDEEIHILPQSKIKSLQLEVQNADEAVNQLNVSYYNREAIKDSSFSISENAAIKNLQGRVNAEEVKFPYFMNQRNAAVVAQWKLKQLSTPAWSGTFTTGFYTARKWNRYDIVKISWPQKNIIDLPVRIMSIGLGSGANNTVTIDFIEVVPYSNNLSPSVVIDTPIDTAPLPPQLALFKAFELSYFEAVQLNGQRAVDDELAYNPDIGYAAAIAQRPQSNSLNALMYTSAGGEYEKSSVIQYCETAVLDQDINRTSNSFAVKNAGNIGSVRAGSQITVNDETMVYQSFDAATKILTVKRGALDTVPQSHTSGAVLYFADDFVAVDPAEYAVSEIIDVKALTTTPSGVLSLEAPGQKVQITGRAIRPYPPANVKINGLYFPETSIVTSDLVLSWEHRNRVQQTGGEILGWYDGGVTAEAGMSYSVEISSAGAVLHSAPGINAGTYTIPASVLIQNKPHRLKIWAVRDGYDSHQKFEHNFFVEAVSLILTASVSKDKVTGSTLPAANISVDVDESLKANLQFDGSGISGKAPAGSIITVEIEE